MNLDEKSEELLVVSKERHTFEQEFMSQRIQTDSYKALLKREKEETDELRQQVITIDLVKQDLERKLAI